MKQATTTPASIASFLRDQQLCSAIEANNEGAQLFQLGLFGPSKAFFTEAVALLKEALAIEPTGEQEEDFDACSGPSHASNPTPHDAASSSKTTVRLHWSERATLCSKSGISVFVFSRALEIENLSEGLPTLRLPKDAATSCAIAMLYNLALSLHHTGIEDDSQKQLHKARQIYIEVNQLLLSPGRETDVCSGSTRYDYLKTVLLNNVGHISHEGSDVISASECFQLMISEIGKLVLAGEFEQHFPSDDDKTGFAMNTLLRVHTAGAA